MRLYSLHLRQNLGSLALATQFLVASLKFLNVDCSGANVCLVLMPLTCFHCETSVVSSISATTKFDYKHLLLTMGTVYPLQYCSWVWPKLHYLSSFQVPWLSVLSTSPPQLPLATPVVVLKDVSFLPLFIFQWQMQSQLSLFLALNVDRPLHTSYLQMRQQTHEVQFYPSLLLKYLLSMLVSATIGSCSSHFPNSDSSPDSTSLSQFCPFSVQMPFRSLLIWTLNGANNPIGSNTEDTNDKIFLLFIGASNFLVGTSAHLKTIISNGPL